jgi:hypothetical protein
LLPGLIRYRAIIHRMFPSHSSCDFLFGQACVKALTPD